MKINKKLIIRSVKDVGINLVAALFIGLAVKNFASANDFPMSGINGIMLLLHHFFGTPIGFGTILLNIPILIICHRFLSKKFVLKSIATMITIALVIDLVCPLFPTFTADKMLAVICAGTLSGIGSAMIFANNSSGGGLDFVTMSIKSRRPYFSVGSISFAVAAVIITISGICYHDFTGIIYGAILQFISAMIMDKILYRMNEGKLMLIISDQTDLIAEDPEYGEIICRCQKVTKREIRNAIENPLGVRSITAIKYRAWATTGRCNGGYCLTRIVNMLVNEYGMKPEEITYRGKGGELFSGEVK